MNNVTEKIRKLLAKASSNNEHEAAAALMKARALMAKYKVDERDVQDAAPSAGILNHVPFTAETYSGLKNAWFLNLSNVIVENHCCARYSNHMSGRTTHTVVFTGLDEDPHIANEVFTYAVQHIHAQAKEYARYIRTKCLYPADEIRQRGRAWESSYAEGFTRGLAAKYAEQVKNDDTGTMAITVVTPPEVTAYMGKLRKSTLRIRNNGENENAARSGFTAGYTFNPRKQIPGA